MSEISDPRRARFFSRLTLLCAIATALPIFSARFLPMTDLPEHVAAIATLRHWLDPSWGVQTTYTLALGKTEYLLYHLTGALLAIPFGDAELANRVLLALVAIGFPYSARALLRAQAGDERLAVLACAAFWCRPLRIGFLPYVASVPCVLFALAVVVRQLEHPTRTRAVALAIASVAIFYVHLSGFMLFALVTAAFTLLSPTTKSTFLERVVELALRSSWLLPSLLVALLWALHGDGPVVSGTPSQVWYMPARDRIADFPLWAHDIWKGHAEEWFAVALWMAIAWIALVARKSDRSSRDRARAWAPLVCTLLLYFVLPTQVGAAASVNERLALFFPVFLLLVLRPRDGFWGDAPVVIGALAVLGIAFVAGHVMRAASREEAGDFDALIAHTRPNAKLVSLIFQPSSEFTDISPWLQLGSFHRARKGGVASFSFSEIPHWPIHYKDGAAPPAHHPFWEFDPCVYRNAVDGPYYDYVLTRGALDPFRDSPPGPKWRVVAKEKQWTLFEKIPDATNAAWPVEDRGPCESRWSAEKARD